MSTSSYLSRGCVQLDILLRVNIRTSWQHKTLRVLRGANWSSAVAPRQSLREMKETTTAGEMSISVDERYTQWKSLVPVLYDWLANHNLVWPSLSCRFVCLWTSPSLSRVSSKFWVFSFLLWGLFWYLVFWLGEMACRVIDHSGLWLWGFDVVWFRGDSVCWAGLEKGFGECVRFGVEWRETSGRVLIWFAPGGFSEEDRRACAPHFKSGNWIGPNCLTKVPTLEFGSCYFVCLFSIFCDSWIPNGSSCILSFESETDESYIFSSRL